MDGWVIVGTKLDTKQLEKDLKSAERQLSQYEREAEKLTKTKAKIEIDLQDYERQKQLIEESTNETLKLAQTEEQVNNVLEIEKMQLDELNQKYSKQFTNLESINNKIKENAKNQGLVKNEIQKTNEKLNQAKGFGKIKKYINDAGNSMNKLLKKVSRWALAVIGIRTAYNGIRSAINLVSSKNEEIASQFEVMKNAIANALAPLVQQIVNWLAKILIYVNQIVKAFTGKYLFDFDKAFADAKENASETEKTVKSIGKQLAGFDEMNVLSDTTDKSSNKKENETIVNPFENWQDVELPGWLKSAVDFIKEFKEELGLLGLAIIALMGASKLSTGLLGLASVLKGLATIGVIAIGVSLVYTALTGRDIVKDLQDIYDGINKLPGVNKDVQKSTEGVTNSQKEYIDSLTETISKTDKLNDKDRTKVTNLARELVGLQKRNKEIKKTQKETGVLQGMFDYMTGTTKTMVKSYEENEKRINNITEAYKKLHESGQLTITQEKIYQVLTSKDILFTSQKIKKIEELLEKEDILRLVQEKGLSYEEAYKKIKGDNNFITNDFIEIIKKEAKQLGFTDEQINEVSEAYYKMLSSTDDTIIKQDKFKNKIIEVAKEAGLTSDQIFNLAKGINGLDSKTISLITKFIPQTNELQKVLDNLHNSFKNVNLSSSFGGLFNFPKIKLAKGGIINNPGRGVPLTSNVVGGEVTREGVIPYTDTQFMQELGSAIGKYITINANIVNTMNGRVISREMKKIQNADDFAFNG